MDLNEDLAIEILVNLPVKSVLRFRSVCKSWLKLIDSSAFRKLHFNNLCKNNNDDEDGLLFLQFSRGNHTWELSLCQNFPSPFQEFLNINDLMVDGPINGLICMYDDYPSKNESIAICNPCLEEIKILPPSPICSRLFDSENGCLGRIVGFGFDSDYKVVQLMWSYGVSRYIEVYSSGTNTWRAIDTDIIGDDDLYLVIFDQIKTTYKRSGRVAYWWIDGGPDEDVVLSFDMQNEVFEKERGHGMFVKDDDSLVLFAHSVDHSVLEVWELDKERGWCHVRNVDHRQFDLGWEPRAIAFWKYGVLIKVSKGQGLICSR